MLKIFAYAKFDLGIHIEPKKTADGYYPVHYIDCQIDLHDELFFEKREGNIEVICNNPAVPDGEDNFVWRAALALKKISGKKNMGAKITLVKNIPIKAGFGGGSSDGAATVIGLSRLFSIKLSEKQMAGLARDLGKDFYYSLYGKLSEVVGRGKNYEVVPFSSRLPVFWLLVVVPIEEKPSTGWVYEHLKTSDLGGNSAKIIKLKTAILKRDKMGILNNLTNDFESIVSSFHPVVSQIKDQLARSGAQASIMAGAGLSVAGFFESRAKAQKARGKLKGKYQKVLIAKTIN